MAPFAKSVGVFLLAVAEAAAVGGGPRGHRHLHLRHGEVIQTAIVTVPIQVYEFNGQMIPESQVCEGLANGTFHWAPGSMDTPNCGSVAPASSGIKTVTSTNPGSMVIVTVNVTASPGPVTTHAIDKSVVIPLHPQSASSIVESTTTGVKSQASNSLASSISSAVSNPSASAKATSTLEASPVAAPSSSAGSSSAFVQTNSNVDVEFPDGEIDCSEFPVSYGAIHIPWMELGGWTGIQFAEISGNLVTGLSTGVTGNNCTNSADGSATFCSYACPPGYQKSQWPATQGSSSMAVSVGGLKCQNGKLYLTNPSLSSNLCIAGTGKTSVVNKLTGSASICRTDYPGTEDETVPLQTNSGNTYPLTCPDSSTYYQHLGAQTSAEYYVNNKDVPVATACQWGTDGTDQGNWAPVVIGAETDSTGATWLSIMTSRQNDPTNYRELDFSIELVGDFGGAACFYTQAAGVGYYCTTGALADFSPSQQGCKSFDPSAGVTVPGCTVQLFSGTAAYHLVETAN